MQHDRYKTILVIVTGLLVLSWIFTARESAAGPVLGKIACAIGVISLVSATAAKWIEWGWFKLALMLGWINSRILLSVIYFIFLLPIATLARLFSKDPLKLRGKSFSSIYQTRDHLYKKEDLENIW